VNHCPDDKCSHRETEEVSACRSQEFDGAQTPDGKNGQSGSPHNEIKELAKNAIPHPKECTSQKNKERLESKRDRLMRDLDPCSNGCQRRKHDDPKYLCKDVRAALVQRS